MNLLKFWREMNPEAGTLKRPFQVESGDTRFLGDLYQELSEKAKKTLMTVPIANGTIPFQVNGLYGAGSVLLRPASDGTGVIAGGGVRAVVELAGIHNVLAKCLGSNNPHNMVKATIQALSELREPEKVAAMRGKELAELR